jgi:hypothetical protein
MVEHCLPACQSIPGSVVDATLSELILQSVSPLALEVALNVQQELQQRLAQSDRLRHQYVERAQYEAEQARVRFMRVDPNNRLVADTLEALWNDKLRQLDQAREDYEKQRESGQRTITQQQKAQILALAEDFPRLWKDPGTADRDRKRMARLILEDVTLNRDHTLITAQVRFKGGATKVLRLPTPPRAWQLRKTKVEIVAEIDRLLRAVYRLRNRDPTQQQGLALVSKSVVQRADDPQFEHQSQTAKPKRALTRKGTFNCEANR